MTMMPKTKLSEDSPPRAPERVHLARGSPPRPSHMVHAGSGLLALKQRYSPPLQRKHLPYIGQQNELDPRFPQQMPGCCLYARAQLPPGAQQDSQSEEARTVAMARRTARAREPSMYGRRRTMQADECRLRVETQSPQFRYYGYGYMYLCTVWCCSRSRQFALSRYERANSSCELIRLVSYSQQ